ncbi:MAG: polyribonucleotide nucleotidyltransferase, partial [Acidobacteria bacterium]|nr:polyribonucleotide nucleotidyltransferase [Candidatus Sulfomarinibacter sp. MAG AM2]
MIEIDPRKLLHDRTELAQDLDHVIGQAGGAVTVRQGDSVLLAAATMSSKPREGLGFFPLTVDYEERLYAGGRIPGSFFRREGRPTEGAIITARLTDRTIRPLFPKDMRNEVQVILYALSSDGETPLDVLGLLGASAALTIADVPFAGPVGTVRVAKQDGNFVINPTYQVIDESDLDLVIAGTSEAIMMVEAGAKEIEEAEIVKAFEVGQETIKALIDLQVQMQAEVGKEKRSYPSFQLSEEVQTKVSELLEGRVQDLVSTPRKKAEQSEALNALRDEALEAFADEEEWEVADIREAFEKVHKAAVRSLILETKTRTDGRGPKDIREIHSEVDFSPRAHGSGLFTRGETQVLTLATVGTPRERQELDGLSPRNEKRYMHHYNFPPFSVGETKFLRGASRREIGHGALAERALLPVIPSQEEFPYTMRLVSEVLSSNGSSSMATVCGGSLAMMDAGVPIKKPVAGVAMGMITEDGKYAILTDILGLEDHLGDMDFKVTGTRDGVTGFQMDVKVFGIAKEIMTEALEQAKRARLQILDIMDGTIDKAKDDISPYAPKIHQIKVHTDKIR